MADEIKKKFNRGDFLRKNNKKGSFMIYEGNNLSDTAYKRMTLICIYDPEKYVMGSLGYEQKPTLEVGTRQKACIETIDTEEEDYWIKLCNDQEKAEAIEILKEYGYHWNEETLELVDIETGEVVRKVMIPDNTYHGQIIKPISQEFKEIIKTACTNKNKVVARYSPSEDYDYYD